MGTHVSVRVRGRVRLTLAWVAALGLCYPCERGVAQKAARINTPPPVLPKLAHLPDTAHTYPPGYATQGDLFYYFSDSLTMGMTAEQYRKAHPHARWILFLGNSSTGVHMMPEMLHDLLWSQHQPCVVGMIAPGGVNLIDLWRDTLPLRIIQGFPWTDVVLQERATIDSVSFVDAARGFVQAIVAKHARPYLFNQYLLKRREQQANIDAQNMGVAAMLGMTVVPNSAVVDAAIAADSSMRDTLFMEDGFHPSTVGAYLNAVMMYHVLTGRSPVGLPVEVGRQVVRLSVARELQHAALIRMGPLGRQISPPVEATAGPVLTPQVLGQLTRFEAAFRAMPDSIWQGVRQQTRKQITVYIGLSQFPLQAVDMVTLAQQEPPVATSLTQAGLTASEWEADRLAYYRACMTLQWRFLGSAWAARALPATTPLRQNIEMLQANPQASHALDATGMGCPVINGKPPEP